MLQPAGNNHRNRSLSAVRVVAVLVLTLAISGCGAASRTAASSLPVTGGGSQSSYVKIPGAALPAAPGGVTESDGTSWTYRGAQKGRITLLYFGYTSCPDVCPTTMADLALAVKKLPAATRARVDVQFVSTDPHRDTPHQLTGWLAGFDPSFRGGRAPIASVISAARAYGISIDPPKVTASDYQVTHGAQVLVLAPGGTEVGYFRELAGATSYGDQLPRLVRRYA